MLLLLKNASFSFFFLKVVCSHHGVPILRLCSILTTYSFVVVVTVLRKPCLRASCTILRLVLSFGPVCRLVAENGMLLFFSSIGSMVSARAFHTATILQTQNVLVCGGLNGVSNAMLSCELYNVTSGVFSATGISYCPRVLSYIALNRQFDHRAPVPFRDAT
jgi:hypothetical protein